MTRRVDSKQMTATAIARRLLLTRQALRLSQKAFATGAGIRNNTYNQAETGRQRIGLDTAIALSLAYNLTLDWIYFGDNSGLRHELVEAMRAMSKIGRLTDEQ